MVDTTEIFNPIQTDSLKLIKNSRGYTWEIKLASLNIDEIERLNNEFIRRFDIKETNGNWI